MMLNSAIMSSTFDHPPLPRPPPQPAGWPSASASPRKQGNSSYTTVFESPRVVCRKLVNNHDRLQYLLHGLQPLQPSSARAAPKAAAPAAALDPLASTSWVANSGITAVHDAESGAAQLAREHVERHIAVREYLVAELTALLPTPRLPEQRDDATQRMLLNPFALGDLRGSFAKYLHELRRISAAICAGIAKWRVAVKASSTQLSSMPNRELTFCWNGCSYLLKMVSDLPFLPCPIAYDPLLLDWFNEHLPWLVTSVPRIARRKHSSLAKQLALTYDAPELLQHTPDEYFGPAHPYSQNYKEANFMLIEEAARCCVSRAPAHLARNATRKAHSSNLGERWQWSAWQVVLYGGECYYRMLRSLPTCVQTLHLSEACITVQRAYRSRIARKLLRAMKETVARERHLREQKAIWAAVKMQQIWRGFFLRSALRDVIAADPGSAPSSAPASRRGSFYSQPPQQQLQHGRRPRKTSEAAMKARQSLQARKEKKERRYAEQNAANVIQRRARMTCARAEVHKARQHRDAKRRGAKATVNGSGRALDRLRDLVIRQRVLRVVLCGLYDETIAAERMPELSPSAPIVKAPVSATPHPPPSNALTRGNSSRRGGRVSREPTSSKDGVSGRKQSILPEFRAGGSSVTNAAPPRRTLEEAAALAMAPSLKAARKLSSAIGRAEEDHRKLGIKIAGAAMRALSAANQPSGRGDHSAVWSELVQKASAEASAASAASRSCAGATAGKGEDSCKQLSDLIEQINPCLIGQGDVPRASVDVLTLIAGGKAAQQQAKLVGTQSQAEARAWGTVAASRPSKDSKAGVAAAEAAAEKSRARLTAAVANLRVAESELEAASHGKDAQEIEAEEDEEYDDMLTPVTSPAPPRRNMSTANAPKELPKASLLPAGPSTKHRMRMVEGSKIAVGEVKNWRTLPHATLASGVAVCELVSKDLTRSQKEEDSQRAMRAAVEEAGLAHAKAQGEASVANAMVRLLHELDQLEKKKQSVQGMHEARQASAAREGAANAEGTAAASFALVQSIDSFVSSSEKDVSEWLLVEGRLNVLRPLLATTLQSVRQLAVARRREAYRELFAIAPIARVRAQHAALHAQRLDAACQFADSLAALPVHESTYEEARLTVTLRKHVAMSESQGGSFNDTADMRRSMRSSMTGPTLASTVTLLSRNSPEGDEARDKILAELALTTGIADEERLYMISHDHVDEADAAEGGEVRLIIGVKKAGLQYGDAPDHEVLAKLEETYTTGRLGDIILGKTIGKGAISSCVATQACETTVERPPLPLLQVEANEKCTECATSLTELSLSKEERESHRRAWERALGAVKGLWMAALPLEKGDEEALLTVTASDITAAMSSVVDLPADAPKLPTPQRLIQGWAGMHDGRVLEVAASREEKRQRQNMRQQLNAAHGQLLLLAALQESCSEWPKVKVPGKDTYVDVRWNVGLDKKKGPHDLVNKSSRDLSASLKAPPPGTHARAEAQFCCYYCASLPKPVRAPHRLVDCPKRVKANEKEFTQAALDSAVAKLKSERAEQAALYEELTLDAISAEEDKARRQELKRESLRCSGVINVIDALCGTPPPPPPLPMQGGRRDELKDLSDRRGQIVYQFIKRLAMASVDSGKGFWGSFSADRGWWGELRSTAMMAPQPRAANSAVTPQRVISIAKSVEVSLEPGKGQPSDFQLIPLALELTRAPLPQFWAAKAGSDGKMASDENDAMFVHLQTGETRSGHPSASQLTPWVRQRRAALQSKSHPRPTDSWVVFAKPNKGDANNAGLYCYDFATGTTSDELLPSAVKSALRPSKLPPATLEPSAVHLAASANQCWPGLKGTALLNTAKRELWERSGVASARAVQLCAQPCPLDLVVQMAIYLGIEPTTHPQLMWLAHAALSPESLPAGWAAATDQFGETYYWNKAMGLCQWDHPQVAFLCGVAAKLIADGC